MRWFNLTGGGSQTETRQYNALGQMTRLTVPGQLDLEYRFSATANDNKAISQKNYISGEELEYQYDSLGRLSRAETTVNSGSAPQWGLSWVYDGFGNRLQQNAIKGTVPTQSILVDPVTNRVQSHTFDANGNTTSTPAQGTMTYDVTDRLKTVASDAYNYSPANQRQWKNSDFVLWGADGQRLVTAQVAVIGSDLRFTQTSFDSYSHGRRLQVSDRLGSVGGYYPYGDAKSGTVSNADSFATYYRDSTALDYAQQRYYQPASGRFLTTDPLQASAKVDQPESWNRYPYAASDPINGFDPSGLSTATACTLYAMFFHCTATTIGGGFVQTGQSSNMQLSTAITGARSDAAASVAQPYAPARPDNGVSSYGSALVFLLHTKPTLEAAAATLALGLSDDCWNFITTSLQKNPTNNLVDYETLLKRLASPVFRDGLNTTNQYAREQVSGRGVYAWTPFSNDGNAVYWRPGESGIDRVPNWLLGAVLHEHLHTFDLSDAQLQSAFGVTIGAASDNITLVLVERCFR